MFTLEEVSEFGRMSAINQSVIFINVAEATNSCFKGHEKMITNKRTVKRLDQGRKGEISAFLNDA